MEKIMLPLFACLLACGCGREPEHPEESKAETQSGAPAEQKPALASAALAEYFPLLPLIEKRAWAELLELEKSARTHPLESGDGRAAGERIRQLAGKLRRRHPFRADEKTIRLGGVTYQKPERRIEISAVVSYPDTRDQRHPGELELVLCSSAGRAHETLFVTSARPLHLELLLHLAGFSKNDPASLFRVHVVPPGGAPVAVESLIERVDGAPLPERLRWQFTGSGYDDLYSPDQTGDLLILWRAHDSVLSVDDEKIASGETKLKAKKNKRLPQGAQVTVVLTPAQK